MNNLSDQKKGSLLAFVAVMFITPDSLFIRLSSIDTWSLVFYRGAIPFLTVFLGMLLIYKLNFFKILFTSGHHGLIYIATFSVTNIAFVVSIQSISFAPKSTKGWKGTMVIGGNDFRVRSIKASYGDIYIEQEYSSKGSFYTKNFIWRFSQTEYRQDVISVNTISKPKKNSPMMVAYIPEAANTDPDYWQQYRSIDPEVDARTRKQDSLIRYLNSDEYLDSADAVYNEFHWYEPLVSGVGYRKRSKGTFFYYSPLIGQWNFVGIGGTRWTPAFIGSKRFSNYQSVEGQFVPNYGFLNNDLKSLSIGFIEINYYPLPRQGIVLSIIFLKVISNNNPSIPIIKIVIHITSY